MPSVLEALQTTPGVQLYDVQSPEAFQFQIEGDNVFCAGADAFYLGLHEQAETPSLADVRLVSIESGRAPVVLVCGSDSETTAQVQDTRWVFCWARPGE